MCVPSVTNQRNLDRRARHARSGGRCYGDRGKSRIATRVGRMRFAHCGSRGGIRDGGRDSRWRGGSCDCAANRDGADKLRTREIIEHGIHGDSPAF